MGQVELNIMGSMEKLQNCILMHVDDINDINALILVSRSLELLFYLSQQISTNICRKLVT